MATSKYGRVTKKSYRKALEMMTQFQTDLVNADIPWQVTMPIMQHIAMAYQRVRGESFMAGLSCSVVTTKKAIAKGDSK